MNAFLEAIVEDDRPRVKELLKADPGASQSRRVRFMLEFAAGGGKMRAGDE